VATSRTGAHLWARIRFCQLRLGEVCTISNQFRRWWSQSEHDSQWGMVFLTKVVYEFIFSWCRPGTDLFRGLPLCFGFHGFRADSNVCDGQKSWNYFFRLPFLWEFNSFELFTIPRLDSIIHNSGFSNSKYSLFIFF